MRVFPPLFSFLTRRVRIGTAKSPSGWMSGVSPQGPHPLPEGTKKGRAPNRSLTKGSHGVVRKRVGLPVPLPFVVTMLRLYFSHFSSRDGKYFLIASHPPTLRVAHLILALFSRWGNFVGGRGTLCPPPFFSLIQSDLKRSQNRSCLNFLGAGQC